VRTGLRRLGFSMITLGFFTLYFLVYQLVGTNAVTSRAQDSLRDELTDQFAAASAEPQAAATPVTSGPDLPAANGEPCAQLKIPRIDGEYVVVEGSDREAQRAGPGRIPNTKLPGEEGTFAIAGHRTTYGGPFFDVDQLEPGDELIVETKYATFTYEVTKTEIVAPTQISVLDDVQGEDGQMKQQIVLSTCHPKFSAAERMIVFGELSSAQPRGGTEAA
jgi:sortase A